MMEKQEKAHISYLSLVCVMVLSFLAVKWTLSPANGFAYDDYTLLSDARFTDYTHLFSLWPNSLHNDRQVQMIFLKLLNSLFGTQYIPYHYISVVIHLINVALVYGLVNKIFINFGAQNTTPFAVLAAAIFGIYPNSLMAVSWISSTCDLQCCLFVLLAATCYFKGKENSNYTVFYTIAGILFYYLSLRSKEMSLLFPVILLVYEITLWLEKKQNRFFNGPIVSYLVFMLVYFLSVILLGDSIPPNDQYYQNFNPLILLRNAVRYFFIYFDWTHSGFEFSGYRPAAIPGITLFALAALFSFVVGLHKKRWGAFAAFIATMGAVVPVLPMVNMQHHLYLPSMFIGLFFAAVLYEITLLTPKFKLQRGVALLVLLLFCINGLSGNVQYKANWLAHVQLEQAEWDELQKLPTPDPGTTYYVKGASEGYNIFFYGPGNALRLVFDEGNLETILVNEFPENPPAPCVFLLYEEGMITEVDRRVTVPFASNEITSTWPAEIVYGSDQFNQDGTLFMAIITSGILDAQNTEILLNGENIPYEIGDGFVTVTVQPEMLMDGRLVIALRDAETGKIGKSFTVPVRY